MPLLPYNLIFPDKNDPVMTMELARKHGRIPKGSYAFLELYCEEKGCDCRQVMLVVLNKKLKEKAAIFMGFDPAAPLAGPFLAPEHPQSPCAGELLECFVELLNRNPAWLEMLYAHYREVRRWVEGKPYRGKAFPNPKKIKRVATTAEPQHDDSLPVFMEGLPAIVNTTPMGKKKASGRGLEPQSLRLFLKRYLGLGKTATSDEFHALQDELRQYLLHHENVGDEIATLLVDLCTAISKDHKEIEAALRILFDILEVLRVELERERAGSRERMAEAQGALARRVFLESGDADLCAAASQVLLESRVELLPVLFEANSRRIATETERIDPRDIPDGYALDGLFESIEEMGHDSPFEAMGTVLQLIALAPAEMQIVLCKEMLSAASPLIRETGALMILHPTSPEVRRGVSALLAAQGKKMTPETLRRLIICRNWFPEDMRKNIDEAIASARRGRVECSPLPRSHAATVYASVVDGAGAQSVLAIVPAGKGFKSCSILLKHGVGVADAFVIPLPNKRDLNSFLGMMKEQGASFMESSPDYLNRRVCHGLADGLAQGKVPNSGLLQVAEVLGQEQWQAVPFEPMQELAGLRQELAGRAPDLLTAKARARALQDSGGWTDGHSFTDSWFEDDAEVDRVIEAALNKGGKKRLDERKIVAVISKNILEKRRAVWLWRLTLTALWLKSSPRPPVPWHQMFHLAEAVADERQALATIPLMQAIAFHSLRAFLVRLDDANS